MPGVSFLWPGGKRLPGAAVFHLPVQHPLSTPSMLGTCQELQDAAS